MCTLSTFWHHLLNQYITVSRKEALKNVSILDDSQKLDVIFMIWSQIKEARLK